MASPQRTGWCVVWSSPCLPGTGESEGSRGHLGLWYAPERLGNTKGHLTQGRASATNPKREIPKSPMTACCMACPWLRCFCAHTDLEEAGLPLVCGFGFGCI